MAQPRGTRSPRSPKRQIYEKTPNDLQLHITSLRDDLNTLQKLWKLYYSMGKQPIPLTIPPNLSHLYRKNNDNVLIINNAFLNEMLNTYKKKLTAIKNIAGGMRKRKSRAATHRNPFGIAQVFSAEAMNFLQGYQFPPDVNGQDIKSKLEFFANSPHRGILNTISMSNFLMTYINEAGLVAYATVNGGSVVNGVPQPARQLPAKYAKGRVGVDKYMRDNLSEAIAAAQDRAGQPKTSGDVTDVYPPFDPHNFSLAGRSTLATLSTVSPDKWTQGPQGQLELIGYDPQTGKTGMNAREKMIYKQYVLDQEAPYKTANENAKNEAKSNKTSYAITRIPYEDFLQKMSNDNLLTEPIRTQVLVDIDTQTLTIYRNNIHASQ